MTCGEELDTEDYQAVKLFERRAVTLIPRGHRLYENESVSFAELKGEPIIMEGDDFWINGEFRRRCLEAGFAPDIVIETGDISFCHKLCAMGRGLGISMDFVADFIRSDELRVVPLREELLWPVYLVYRRTGVLSQGARMFRNYLLDAFRIP